MKQKIKGSLPFFTPKKLGIVYIVSLLICVPLRILHVLGYIEPQTGFFIKKDFTVVIFFAVLAFAFVFLLLGAYLSKEAFNVTDKTVNKNKPVGIIALFLSLSFFLDFGYCFVVSVDGEEAYSYTAGGTFAAMMRSGSLPRKAEMVFALLSFIYMLLFAIKVLSGKFRGQLKVFSLVTVFWGISRLVTLFVRQISFIRWGLPPGAAIGTAAAGN